MLVDWTGKPSSVRQDSGFLGYQKSCITPPRPWWRQIELQSPTTSICVAKQAASCVIFIVVFFSLDFFFPTNFLEREPFPTCRWPSCIAPGANRVAEEGSPLYKRLSEGIGAERRRLI